MLPAAVEAGGGQTERMRTGITPDDALIPIQALRNRGLRVAGARRRGSDPVPWPPTFPA